MRYQPHHMLFLTLFLDRIISIPSLVSSGGDCLKPCLEHFSNKHPDYRASEPVLLEYINRWVIVDSVSVRLTHSCLSMISSMVG